MVSNNKGDKKYRTYFWNAMSFVIFIILFIVLLSILYLANNRLPGNISVFHFIVLSFAVHRLTRLFVYDIVTEFIRDYFKKRMNESGFARNMAQLLGCPWCTSMWFALLVFFLYFLHPVFWFLIFILALAGVASYLQLIISLLNKIVNKNEKS